MPTTTPTTLRDMRLTGIATRRATARAAGVLPPHLLATPRRHFEGLTHANP